MAAPDPWSVLSRYPLVDALRDRRSRRFGLGMEMPGGPLAYRSDRQPVRLSEEEEAALAFAACGITGPALGDLDYGPGGGGTIMAGMAGRTAGSGDAIDTVSVFVTNEDGTWLLRRPRDFPAGELREIVALAREGRLVDLYRRVRVRVADGRTAPPLEPFYNLAVNRWSLYDPGSTYFLPVNELTLLYINGVLEILGEEVGAFIVDERASFRPAGLGRFGRRRGGHLRDDPRDERSITIQQLESLVVEFVTVEQGMILQNLALMAQALGLGGFPHWAAHPFGWLEALGFRTRRMRGSRYLGMNRLLGFFARLLGRDPWVVLGLGLEKDGEPLLTPFCPPYYPSMEAAVLAVVELKFGEAGVFRGGAAAGAWKKPGAVRDAARRPSEAVIEAAIAYCEYVHSRYGRFPAYPPPFRTVLGFQVSHVDPAFYERHYRDGALSDTQRTHMELWHPGGG